MNETRYHEAGHTLDPSNPIEDDAPRAASTSEAEAEAIKTASEEHADAVEAETEAAAERAAEQRTDLKPSETLQARGLEPTPEDDMATTEDDGVPDGTVTDVLDWAGDDQDRIQQALNAERAGQNRATLIAELERRQEA